LYDPFDATEKPEVDVPLALSGLFDNKYHYPPTPSMLKSMRNLYETKKALDPSWPEKDTPLVKKLVFNYEQFLKILLCIPKFEIVGNIFFNFAPF
jgi:hypothetical protein